MLQKGQSSADSLALPEDLLGGQSQNHEPVGSGKGVEVRREADLWGAGPSLVISYLATGTLHEPAHF